MKRKLTTDKVQYDEHSTPAVTVRTFELKCCFDASDEPTNLDGLVVSDYGTHKKTSRDAVRSD